MTVAKGRTVMTRKVVIDWTAEDTVAALHARYRSEKVAEVRAHRQGGHGPLLSDGGAGPAGGASNSIVMDWYKSGFGVAESTPCPPFGVLR